MKEYTVTYDSQGAEGIFWEPTAPTEGIFFLHGWGERRSEGIRLGSGVNLVKKHAIPKMAAAGNIPIKYLVFAPQCPADSWTDMAITNALKVFDEKCKELGITIRHCTGLSMGGHGTFRTAKCAHKTYGPGYFTTYGVICGWGDSLPTPDYYLGGSYWKLWHGTEDSDVSLSRGALLYAQLRGIKANVEHLISLRGNGHNVWDLAYNPTSEESYWNWILNPQANSEELAQLRAELEALKQKRNTIRFHAQTLFAELI